MSDLFLRLSRLSPEQRTSLAAQLNAGNSEPANTRLVAFIVPKAGSSVDINNVRKALAERLPDYMIPSLFQTLDELPLTPNGKVDHATLRRIEPGSARPQSGFAEPTSKTERMLVHIWREVLALESVGIHDNFFEIGGDSILSIHIVSRARQSGLEITPALLFKHPTIAELAAVARMGKQVVDEDQGLVRGKVPLTPIQHWFFENQFAQPAYWNQALLLKVNMSLNATDLQASVEALIRHHDVLRTRFILEDEAWTQELSEMPDTLPVEVHDLRGQAALDQTLHIQNTADRLHRSLHLELASLFKVAQFHMDESQDELLFILHHLITDAVSWRLLLDDLHTALQQTGEGRPIKFPHKTTAFQSWSEQLQKYVELPQASKALDYWLTDHFRGLQLLPRDFANDEALNTEGSCRVVTLQLSEKDTYSLIEDVPKAYRTKINEVLLTALSEALTGWLQESSIFIAMEGHGREALVSGVDITRTAGWFTSVFPVRLEVPSGDLVERMLSVKDQFRSIPDSGVSYGLLKYSGKYDDAFKDLSEPEFLFNYLGRGDALLTGLNLFELAADDIGTARSPKNRRRYLIEVNCFVRNGCFQSRWSFSHHFHKEQTIQNLATGFHQALLAIIGLTLSPRAGGYSQKDFPLADLSQENLDQIAGLLDSLDD